MARPVLGFAPLSILGPEAATVAAQRGALQEGPLTGDAAIFQN